MSNFANLPAPIQGGIGARSSRAEALIDCRDPLSDATKKLSWLGLAMTNSRREHVYAFFIVLLAVWWATNLSMTVSAFHDGRAVTLGLLSETDEFLSRNTNGDLSASIERLKLHDTPLFSEWMLTSAYQDSLNYMKMAMGDKAYEPYSLRILYPAIVGAIAEPVSRALGATGYRRVSVYSAVFAGFNLLFFLFSLGLAAKYLVAEGIPPTTAAMIALASFLQLGYLTTLYAPMVDQPAVFLSLLFIYLILTGRLKAALVASFLMILTKDSLIILALAPMIAYVSDRRFMHLTIALTMLVSFVGLRIFSDVDPLSMQFGWNVSRGEIKSYILMNHLGTPDGFINWLLGLWSSFGPILVFAPLMLWSRAINRTDRGRLLAMLVISIAFIGAQLLLSGRIARTVTPASIPLAVLTLGMIYKYHQSTIASSISRLIGRVPEAQVGAIRRQLDPESRQVRKAPR